MSKYNTKVMNLAREHDYRKNNQTNSNYENDLSVPAYFGLF
jgi:hypothetical protein